MGLPAGCGQPQRNFGQQCRFQRQLLVGLLQQQQQRVQRELQRFEPQPAEQQQPLQRVRGAFGACGRELFLVFISRDGAAPSLCVCWIIFMPVRVDLQSARTPILPLCAASLRVITRRDDGRHPENHVTTNRTSHPNSDSFLQSRRFSQLSNLLLSASPFQWPP